MAMALSSPPGPTVRLSSSTFSMPYRVRLHQPQHPFLSCSPLPIFSNFRSLLRSSAVSTSGFKISCVSRESSPSTSDSKTGVAVYKPKFYEVLVSDAANALAYAIEDGKTRVEIDFPHVPTFNTTWVGRPFLSTPTNTAPPFRFINPLLPESSMSHNPWKFHLPSTSSTKLPFSFTTKPRIPTHLCFFNSKTSSNKKLNHQYNITPIPASEIPARDRVLDFGKYKGRMLGTLPSTYLRWVSKNLRARDFEEWAIMADQVLQDPYYKDRLEWECAEKVLNGDILTSFSHSLPSFPSSPSFALEEISDRFGWDNEDKLAWSKVNFELLGTSKGGRIPRISQEEGRRRLKQREEEVGGGSVKGEEMGKEERRVGVKGRRNERRDRVRLKKNGGGGMDVRSKRSYDGLEEDREERLEVRLLHRRDDDDVDAFNRFPGREGLLKKVLSSKQRRREGRSRQ